MTQEPEREAYEAMQKSWETTMLEYAQPNSMVDIGEMYWWANYWHEQAILERFNVTNKE